MIHDWGKLVGKNEHGHIVWQTDRASKRWDGWNAVPDGRRLRRGQCLRNHTLVSDNGEYTFVVGEDGAGYLCRSDGPVLWAVFGAAGEGYELTEEGRLISRSADGIARPGNGLGAWGDVNATEMLVTDEGHLVLVDESGQVVWSREPSKGSPEARAKHPRRRRAPAGVPLLPAMEQVPVVRTDFSDDIAWDAALLKVTSPQEWDGGDPLQADVAPVEDSRYKGLTPDQLLSLVPKAASWPIMVVADALAMASSEHHMLVVNLDPDNSGQTVRAIPAAIVEMAINLSLANMEWESFAANAGDDGVVQPMVL
jgi:hypothetical protein